LKTLKIFDIFTRDEFRCAYCGRSPIEHGVVLNADHIVPHSKGGKAIASNLVTACNMCNSCKTAHVLPASTMALILKIVGERNSKSEINGDSPVITRRADVFRFSDTTSNEKFDILTVALMECYPELSQPAIYALANDIESRGLMEEVFNNLGSEDRLMSAVISNQNVPNETSTIAKLGNAFDQTICTAELDCFGNIKDG
jgi:hypothetical protein